MPLIINGFSYIIVENGSVRASPSEKQRAPTPVCSDKQKEKGTDSFSWQKINQSPFPKPVRPAELPGNNHLPVAAAHTLLVRYAGSAGNRIRRTATTAAAGHAAAAATAIVAAATATATPQTAI